MISSELSEHVDADQRRAAGSAKWVKFPEAILPAWVAEHDFRPPDSVVQAFVEVAEQAAFGYHYRAGDLGAAYAPWARDRYGWDVDPELVNHNVDVLQGVTAAIMALSQPGDGLILQAPVYFPFWDLPSSTGRPAFLFKLRSASKHLAEATGTWPIDSSIGILCAVGQHRACSTQQSSLDSVWTQ